MPVISIRTPKLVALPEPKTGVTVTWLALMADVRLIPGTAAPTVGRVTNFITTDVMLVMGSLMVNTAVPAVPKFPGQFVKLTEFSVGARVSIVTTAAALAALTSTVAPANLLACSCSVLTPSVCNGSW